MKQHFLCIGLPTVSTRRCDYLMQTVESILAGIPDNLHSETEVLILNANRTFTEPDNIKHLRNKFHSEFDYGLMRIVGLDQRLLYTPTDPPHDLATWRSKLCIDYAQLLRAGHQRARYFLFLEDDIVCSQQFYLKVKKQINRFSNKSWGTMHFSDLGSIGVLFKDSDLPKVISLLETFHDDIPADWIFEIFEQIKAKADSPTVRYYQSLFQHNGLESSLTGKKSPLQVYNFEAPRWQNWLRLGKRLIDKNC